ncbi:MAG: inorganic phosphate transporter [Nitrospira sp.]|nr:inorganic phosphate transporter [Nitrospira sp.]
MLATLTFLLVLLLAFANGTNDVSKSIATLVGSGVTNYGKAIVWGTLWTVGGAGLSAFVATAMVKTFSTGFLPSQVAIHPTLSLSVLTGAAAWVLFASKTGLPVSTTHALTGSLVGTGLLAYGFENLIWSSLVNKIGLPLLLSPVLAFIVALLFYPMVRHLAARWEGTCLCLTPAYRALMTVDAQGATRTLYQATGFGTPVAAVPARCERADLGFTIGLDSLHWVSSGLTAFARGANDTPKIAAILLLGTSLGAWPNSFMQGMTFAGATIAMGLGSYWGGRRVTEVLAEKVTKMDHVEGLSANLTTTTLVLTSAALGLPVSTTHLSSSAIIGIGLLQGWRAVRWRTVRDMLLAWVVTLPASGIFAGLSYLLIDWLLRVLAPVS